MLSAVLPRFKHYGLDFGYLPIFANLIETSIPSIIWLKKTPNPNEN